MNRKYLAAITPNRQFQFAVDFHTRSSVVPLLTSPPHRF